MPPKSNPKRAGGQRKPKKTKVVLSFDATDRESYLTGFQRRKQERKERAKERLDAEIREEVKRIKERRVEKMKKLMGEMEAAVLEVEGQDDDQETTEYDLPEQTVSVQGLDIAAISSKLGTTIGAPVSIVAQPSIVDNPSEVVETMRSIKKSAEKTLAKSKAMKAKQKMKSKKDGQRKRYLTGKSSTNQKKKKRGRKSNFRRS